MATIAITPDHDIIEAEIFVAAPPERVFQALTDPSQMPRWWGQEGMYRITECKADLRPGGKCGRWRRWDIVPRRRRVSRSGSASLVGPYLGPQLQRSLEHSRALGT